MRTVNLLPSNTLPRLFVFSFTMLLWATTALAQPQLKLNQMAGDSCACQNGGALQASLLVNGTFSAGNTGFSSGLSPNIPCSAGTYWVGNNFQIHCRVGPRFLIIRRAMPAEVFWLSTGTLRIREYLEPACKCCAGHDVLVFVLDSQRLPAGPAKF